MEEKSEKWGVQLGLTREVAGVGGSQIVTSDMKVFLEIEILDLETGGAGNIEFDS